MGRHLQICIDCASPANLASFWAEVLEYKVDDAPGEFNTWAEFSLAESPSGEQWCRLVDPDRAGPPVLFHSVPEHKLVKNRVHLDVFVRGGDIDGEVLRLSSLGAVHVRTDHDGGFAVMQDPEGNEFCVG